MDEGQDGAGSMTEQTDETARGIGGFAAGVLLGVVLGAGVALMFAPDRGDRTRRRLKRRLEQLREETGEGLERMGARARRDLTKRRRQIEDGIERATDRARDIL